MESTTFLTEKMMSVDKTIHLLTKLQPRNLTGVKSNVGKLLHLLHFRKNGKKVHIDKLNSCAHTKEKPKIK